MLLLSLMWFLTLSCSIFVSQRSCFAGSPPCFPAIASPLTTFEWQNWKAQPANSLLSDPHNSILTPLCLFTS